MRINQNIGAFNAFRNLTATNNHQQKSLEKLSSGFRINRAADDASGLVISEGLRSQIGGLQQATRNAQDGVSVVQTAEGALTEVHSMLQRIRDLAVQASNTGSSDADATAAAQAEVSELVAEIDRIASTTKFGSKNLLDGTFGYEYVETGAATAAATVLGAATGDQFSVALDGGTAFNVTLSAATDGATNIAEFKAALQDDVSDALEANGWSRNTVRVDVSDDGNDGSWVVALNSTKSLTTADVTNTPLVAFGITPGAATQSGSGGTFQVGANAGETITVSVASVASSSLGVDSIDLTTGASAAITAVDAAIADVSTIRGDLGAKQNRFEHTVSNLQVTQENLAASESRIRDTDMALEMVNFTRHQILQQAGTAMLAQANQLPQSVLSLLR